jgi:hypothetical protein
LGENLREFWERIEKMRCVIKGKDWVSLYSEMDGQDCSKTIVFNGWEEDLGRIGIKKSDFWRFSE